MTSALPSSAGEPVATSEQSEQSARKAMIDNLLDRGFPLMIFPDNLESDFQRATLASRRAQIFSSSLISLFIFNAFLVADYLMLPDVFVLACVVRLLVITPIALFFIVRFYRNSTSAFFNVSPNGIEIFSMVTGLSAGFALEFILWSSSSPLVYLYHVGFVVVITYGNIVKRMRFWYAVTFSTILIVVHIVSVCATENFPERMVIPLVSMVCASAIFTLFANYALEKDERRRFLLTERERALIRSLTQAQVRLRELMRIDDLTGLYNRRHFSSEIAQLFQRASHGHLPFAVLMIDVDHFKKFNDHYGHPAGDSCLNQVARALKDALAGGGAILARYGGEEFIAALPNVDEASAKLMAERARASVESCQIQHQRSPTSSVVTVSIGLFWCEARPEMKVEHVLALADGALYDAKHQGRNRVCSQST